jgi:triacylglycerol esterase/lipase EstA (alpha/beta hydrolase family)
MRGTLKLSLILPIGLLCACAAPVGVTRMDAMRVNRSLTSSVVSSGELSGPTQIALRRHDLMQKLEDEPEAAILELHNEVTNSDWDPSDVFALGELSYFHAEATEDQRYYFAAAAYAYAFLFPEDKDKVVERIDPRVRVACDIYNMAIARAFASEDEEHVDLRGGEFPLPFGTLSVAFDRNELIWGKRRLTDLIPSAELEVHGLQNRYRRGGVGAPLAARTEPLDPSKPVGDFVGPNIRVPATAVLRFEPPLLQGNQLRAILDLYTETETETVTLAGQTVPLESEPSAALATALAESRFWEFELQGLLGKIMNITRDSRLVARSPHRAGRIPVVFVHGTGSSPARWADMVNDLDSDRALAKHFEFWFFSYDSGNPIAYSSMILRQSLQEAVKNLDPSGTDRCMNEMVVIGHSQGGLLTKMTAIDSGDKFWQGISSRPVDEVNLSDKTRALIKEALFIEPLPFVKRVVFVATPHRGSYLAGPQIIRRLAERLITVPANLVEFGAEIVQVNDSGDKYLSLERIPTSIDNMSPGNAFIKTLSSIPVDPNVRAHSIIPVETTANPPWPGGNDGVVEYSSAHIEGVESELVVYSNHSCQANPHTVAEVSRILHLHADEMKCKAPEAP